MDKRIKIDYLRSQISFNIDYYSVCITIGEETAKDLIKEHSEEIPVDKIFDIPTGLKLHGDVRLSYHDGECCLKFMLI